jgi:Na+/proline symporter
MRFTWQISPLIGISFWLGLFWRRANRYGAWASFLGGAAALLVGLYGFGWRGDAGFPKLALLYLSTGLGCGVAASLLTPPEPESRLDRFYVTIHTPVGQEHYLEHFDGAPSPARVSA